MANMDYPGPCFACSAIDGCSSDDVKQQAVEQYCKGLEMELNAWKARLFDIFASKDEAKDKAGLENVLARIKATVFEIEKLMAQTKSECPASMSGREGEFGQKLEDLRVDYTKALEVISPGWFGG